MSNALNAPAGLLTGQSYTGTSFTQINADFYVDGTYGFDGNPGTSPGLAFRTFLPLSYQLPLWRKNNNFNQQIVVAFSGVVNQEWSSPLVNDVKIVGAAGLPRQATTSGVPNGGGATWLSPSGGTGALLQPNGQGWVVENIFFNNSATAAGCVKLVNAGDPPTANCSEKFTLRNCILTGTDDGVAATDLPNNVLIEGCTFFGFSGSGDLGISSATGAGTGTLNNWLIQNCQFLGNAGHITAPFTSSTLRNNQFSYIYGSVTSTTQILLSGGSNNDVYLNRFAIPSTTNLISGMFSGGTNDRWGPNFTPNAVTTTINLYGVPTS